MPRLVFLRRIFFSIIVGSNNLQSFILNELFLKLQNQNLYAQFFLFSYNFYNMNHIPYTIFHIFQTFRSVFLISDFRRDLNIVYFLLGISPASNCSWPTFRNPVSVPSSKGWVYSVRCDRKQGVLYPLPRF